MNCRRWLCFAFALFGLTAVQAQTGMTPREVIHKLASASNLKGIQVGIVVDTHESRSSLPYAEIVTLRDGDNTAYDALQKSRITRKYEAAYKEPPMVMIKSMLGKGPDKTSDGRRSWAFFISSKDTGEWILSEKGIAQTSVYDGALIGFSRTAWVGSGGSYRVKAEPRL